VTFIYTYEKKIKSIQAEQEVMTSKCNSKMIILRSITIYFNVILNYYELLFR